MVGRLPTCVIEWLVGRWMAGWIDGRMEGWKDGEMDVWMDGWTDGWMDGWM